MTFNNAPELNGTSDVSPGAAEANKPTQSKKHRHRLLQRASSTFGGRRKIPKAALFIAREGRLGRIRDTGVHRQMYRRTWVVIERESRN
jgi:hypothetical protein